MKFTDRVRHIIDANRLIQNGESVLVGVSGGADSVALLHVLKKLSYEKGWRLTALHFNHALRKSAGRDQRFVERLCREISVPLVAEKCMKKYAGKQSVEEFARDCRYGFFAKKARRLKSSTLVLAHHRDDLAETVLMRAIRGTGLAGLAGMSLKKTFPVYGFTVIRPFLSVSRLDIEVYLKEHRLKFVEDPTNCNLNITRNRVRHKLLPYLEQYFSKAVKTNLARLAETAQQDYDYLEEKAQEAYARITQRGNGVVVLEREPLLALHPALRRMVIRAAVREAKGNLNALTLDHVKELESLLLSGSEFETHLPPALKLRMRKGLLHIPCQKSAGPLEIF